MRRSHGFSETLLYRTGILLFLEGLQIMHPKSAQWFADDSWESEVRVGRLVATGAPTVGKKKRTVSESVLGRRM